MKLSKANLIRLIIVAVAVVMLATCVIVGVAVNKNGNTPGTSVAAEVERIEITKKPDKTEYFVGETFSRAGMVVTAVYSDKTSKKVMNYKISKTAPLTKEDKEIIVTFKEKSASVAITVNDKEIETQLSVTSAKTFTYKVEAEDLPMGNEQSPVSNAKYIENHSETQGNPQTSGGKSIGNLNGSNEIIRMKIKSEVEANIAVVMSLAWVEPAGANALKFDENVDTYWNDEKITTDLTVCRDDPADYVWFDWHEYQIANIKLKKGYNDFVLHAKANFPNMDYVKVIVNPIDESKVTGVEITTAPTKTAYYEGETFNADDKMVVSAVIDGANKIEINDYAVDKTILAEGDTAVTISYLGFNATVNVTVTKAEIEKLEVAQMPKKTSYYPGQKFDRTGLKLQATAKDKTLLDVTNFAEYSPETFDNAAETKVTASYGGKTAEIAITVENVEPHVTIKDGTSKSYRIEAENATFVKGDGNKEKYNVVDDGNASGGKRLDSCDWLKGSSFIVVVNSEVDAKVVPIVCCDGGGAVEGLEGITVMTWNGEEIILRRNLDHGWGNLQAVGTGKLDRNERYKVFDLKKGQNLFIIRLTSDVSVNYDYFEFSVNPVDEIAVTKQPTKTTYKVGETFDSAGMEITATYEVTRAKGVEYGENRPTAVVTGYTISPEVIAADTTEITVTYGGRTTTVPIEVTSDKTLTSLSVDYTGKTEYYAGQKFDKTGLTVKANYDDGTQAELTDYTITNETLGLNDTVVTISWKGKTATIPVTVKTHLTIEKAESNDYRIEAEDALFTKGSGDKEKYNVVDDSNASGGKRLDSCDWLAGSSFTITINAKTAMKIKLKISCDGGGAGGNISNYASVTLNGSAVTFTNDLAGGWGNLQITETGTLDLVAGLNTIVITITGNGSVNYDYFELSVVAE